MESGYSIEKEGQVASEPQGSGMNRRTFLRTAGLGLAAAPLMSARSYARILGANDRLQGGLIGCGGMGRAHLNAMLALTKTDNLDLVGVSDVYKTRATHFQGIATSEGQTTGLYSDYRDLLDAKDLDYVTIATPEHWHARMTLDALDAGLHVYVEKPMTHSVQEAFTVFDRVKKSGKKLQVGVQGMSDDSYASAHEAIKSGKIGPVVQAQIDYLRHYPAGQGPWRVGTDPNAPKPDDLDWQQWLGPAPKRPWSAPRYFEWRNYRDYSGGIASDLFIHRLTRIIRACGLNFPTKVVGMGGIFLWDDGRDLPDNLEMLATYPAVEGITPGMTVHVLGTMANDRQNEHLIRGHNATLIFTATGWDIVSLETNEVIESHVKTGGEDVGLHHKNHHDAIRTGAPLNCPPELGLAGVVGISGVNESWFQQKMLTWDARKRNWV